jgi:hypothetical protein
LAEDGATEVSSNHHTTLAFQVLSDASAPTKLRNRYEGRHDRQYQRSFNGLRAYRADKRKDEKEVRPANRAKIASGKRTQTLPANDRHILSDNPNNLKGESPDLHEK